MPIVMWSRPPENYKFAIPFRIRFRCKRMKVRIKSQINKEELNFLIEISLFRLLFLTCWSHFINQPDGQRNMT